MNAFQYKIGTICMHSDDSFDPAWQRLCFLLSERASGPLARSPSALSSTTWPNERRNVCLSVRHHHLPIDQIDPWRRLTSMSHTTTIIISRLEKRRRNVDRYHYISQRQAMQWHNKNKNGCSSVHSLGPLAKMSPLIIK